MDSSPLYKPHILSKEEFDGRKIIQPTRNIFTIPSTIKEFIRHNKSRDYLSKIWECSKNNPLKITDKKVKIREYSNKK